jgi:hypothetical protein
MGLAPEEWPRQNQVRFISMIRRLLGGAWVEQYLLLLFHNHRSTVVVSVQVELYAVMHKISTTQYAGFL